MRRADDSYHDRSRSFQSGRDVVLQRLTVGAKIVSLVNRLNAAPRVLELKSSKLFVGGRIVADA